MEKLLSVSVAAYNVERYLDKTLESCVIPKGMEVLEVIVVNDGSKDRTADIAQQYVDRWPDTFRLINKENGGYGSTVNTGIAAANGKYFRLLDGDDWFDGEALVQFLQNLEDTTEDMVVTPFQRVFESDGHIELRDETPNGYLGSCRFEDLPDRCWFTMHAVTYRTEILKNHPIQLTEHCFYTDQEYDLLPLRWIRTVHFLPHALYCYRIGREEQSVSVKGLEKHYKEQTIVLKKLYDTYAHVSQRKNKVDNYVFDYFIKRTRFHIRSMLVITPTKEHKQELMDFMSYLKNQQPELYREEIRNSRMVKALVYSRYLMYRPLHYKKKKDYRY